MRSLYSLLDFLLESLILLIWLKPSFSLERTLASWSRRKHISLQITLAHAVLLSRSRAHLRSFNLIGWESVWRQGLVKWALLWIRFVQNWRWWFFLNNIFKVVIYFLCLYRSCLVHYLNTNLFFRLLLLWTIVFNCSVLSRVIKCWGNLFQIFIIRPSPHFIVAFFLFVFRTDFEPFLAHLLKLMFLDFDLLLDFHCNRRCDIIRADFGLKRENLFFMLISKTGLIRSLVEHMDFFQDSFGTACLIAVF